jgi:hypothetical protein
MGPSRVGAALFLAACLVSPHAAGADVSPQEPISLLDVPFIPQSEQLCGGAAAAMVLRYWGQRDILAEDFASLLDARASGIRGDVLADAVRRRGWIAQSFRGDNRSAKEHLAAGRPLITLLEDQPGRYHYVVLVGWVEGHVIIHDSARAPFRTVAEGAFSTAWAATDFWTLLILPDPDSPASSAEGRGAFRSAGIAPPVLGEDDCDALVSQGVHLVQIGDRLTADEALSTALARCPTSALAARELAGLRFLQSRWPEAAQLAARAAEEAPDDDHAWRLLASSRFMQDDVDGALRAWNQIGEPTIDLVRVEGLDRTRYAVVGGLLNLAPRAELTATRLQLARRRLALLPVASATRVDYRPVPGGRAEIDAAIVERSRLPDRLAAAATVAHALTERELLFDVAVSPGSGTRAIVAWRWWDARPRVGLSLVAPAAFSRSGLWRLDGFWERQSYEVGRSGGADIVRENRRRLALSYTNWTAANTRVGLGVAFDRWDRSRDYVAMTGSAEHRLASDRLATRIQGAMWPGLGRAPWFGTGALSLAWRSTSTTSMSGRAARLTARAGLDSVSARSPFDVWPGADAGHARDVLARAHPLLTDGVVVGGVFGRTLAHGGIELQAKTFAQGPAHVSVALFSDVARAWHAPAQMPGTRAQIDVGLGLRVRMAGQAPTLRIDAAHGLRDGRNAISAGWQVPWPNER